MNPESENDFTADINDANLGSGAINVTNIDEIEVLADMSNKPGAVATIERIVNFLRGKRLLILGYGREGKSALAFLQKYLPEAKIAVADRNELSIDGVDVFSGDSYLETIKDFDLVIKSPGVEIKDFIDDNQKQKLTSIIDLFLRFCSNKIIGITGTKGKSTTSSLTYHILKTCGKDAILAGNIGKPVFDILPEIKEDTIIVLELSCHQLEFIHASPNVAILLNLYEEHFDHYAKPEDYFTAKKNIYRFLNSDDLFIYGDIFQHANRADIEALPCKTINLYEDVTIPAEQIKTHLIGDHNLRDIFAAIEACKKLGVAEQDAITAVESFQGLPHRLQYVGKWHDITFYNDSIATAQEAVINAITALQKVDTIILGGMDRGLDYHPLVEFIRGNQLRNVILLPETEHSFARVFSEAPYSQNIIPVANMDDAVRIAYQITAEDHICLLSPAAASYNTYKNFEERGDHFCALAKHYGELPIAEDFED